MLCNINFSQPLRDRVTALADKDSMSLLFKKMGKSIYEPFYISWINLQFLGLRVEVHSDLKGLELKQLIAEIAKRDHSKFDCFFMAVSTHGDRGSVIGTDGVHVQIESHILTPFNGANCPSLISKPKVFFLQACRGNEKDFCVEIPDNQTDGNGATEQGCWNA